MLRRVAVVRTDGSEELSTSVIRPTRIRELETLTVINNQEPDSVSSKKTPFFIVTAVETSNLTMYISDRRWRLCGLVVTVPGCRHRGPGFDSGRYQIFIVALGEERCPHENK
jgi:hypothetical protein